MQKMETAGVIFLPIADTIAHVTLNFAWRQHDQSRVIQNFVTLVRDTAESLPDFPALTR